MKTSLKQLLKNGISSKSLVKRKLNSFNFPAPAIVASKLGHIGPDPIELKGTAGLAVFSLYASDIDLFQPYDGTSRQKDMVIRHLQHMIKDPNLLVVEYKTNGKHYSAKQLTGNIFKELRKELDADPFSKVDLLVWDGRYYIELTIVYNYEQVDGSEIRKQIISDRDKYEESGRWYKMVKRQLALLRMRGDDIPEWMVKFLTDPVLGNLYLAISRFEALDRVKPSVLPYRDSAISNIKNDLSKLGIAPRDRTKTHLQRLLSELSLDRLIRVNIFSGGNV